MSSGLKTEDCAHCTLMGKEVPGKTFHQAVPCDECLAVYDEDDIALNQILNNMDFFNNGTPSSSH